MIVGSQVIAGNQVIAGSEVTVTEHDGYLTVGNCAPFDAAKTFDCGQAFRFERDEDGCFSGEAFGKIIRVRQTEPDAFDLIGVSPDDFNTVWRRYFDLDTDYSAANAEILARTPVKSRETMAKAIECGSGIHLLHQEPWETLVSFIVSQNNNIPRIRKILRTLCDVDHAFPTPETFLRIGSDGLYDLRTGFRAKYLYDAAVKVLSGEVSFDRIAACDDYDACARELEKIKGVGAKVSACVLLFGFHKTEAFPVDVWMKKVIDRHFGGELDGTVYGKYAGLAQQYLFYYERWEKGK